MNEIKNIPPVSTFPNDNKLRVVWAFGAVYKNTGSTRVPNIDIMLREILDDGTLSKVQSFIKISVAQLDIVRYMSIWQGRKRTSQFWTKFDGHYQSDKLFTLDTNTSKSIKFIDKKEDSNFSFFPPYRYKFEMIDRKDYWHFANSTFTKINSTKGLEIIIPSMELLTSAFVPNEQKLRYKLLQSNINDVLDEYIKESRIEDNRYFLEMYENKIETNIAFLAFAKLNKITQQRLQRLRESLETGSQYYDRYPVVLPYHPTKLTVAGDGIWLDEKTFFMFRINKYSLPDDHEIILLTDETEINKNLLQDDKDQKYYRNEQEIDQNDSPITNDTNPHTGNGDFHIISEVSVISSSKHKISIKIRKIRQDDSYDVTFDVDNVDGIESLSSGEESSSESTKNVGNIKIDSQSTLNQTKVLRLVIDALNELKDNNKSIVEGKNIIIEKISFIDNKCQEVKNEVMPTFVSILKSKGQPIPLWLKYTKIIKNKKAFLGYRKYLLIKLELRDGNFIYLLEIDRKDDDEGFQGLIFNHGSKIDEKQLFNLLEEITKVNGVLPKAKLQKKYFTFRHISGIDGKMVISMHNILKKAYKNELFCVGK